ncbi:membrane or secreted protein [Urechidicola vernalis]|uniref:Membrane or secreted protein n=1 Tax=Urechidicola vernalis TaxID=3075600 RepID=A0ABU2Y3B4_9FLAO|nr:membrane or secreted protein [Urechidicola sp. P050]MDT0552697.1 membrane or secreted protein [Urechidicola sp. P050]
MKNIILIFIFLFTTFSAISQSPVGAWERTYTDNEGKELRMTVIFTDKYQVATWYDAKTGAFVMTNGGTWSLDGKTMTEKVEFDSNDSENVGNEVSFEVELTKKSLQITGTDNILKRLDNGKPGALQGAWLMSGRKRDGEMQSRNTDRPRKTMKILSGTQFQWIAYNTETKQFMGTGGGKYTTVNGKYTENIEFFSRDDSRVGANLEFNYELKDGAWHHSGFSSKGAPLYEVWSTRTK